MPQNLGEIKVIRWCAITEKVMRRKAEDAHSDSESCYLWNAEQAANPVGLHFASLR